MLDVLPPDRRWWLVDLAEDVVPGNRLVEGRNARAALAAFRADMVEHFYPAAGSYRGAREIVRLNRPTVYDGPLTDAEAFAHDIGWTWAWQMCEPQFGWKDVIVIPGGPATREQATAVLGEELASRMEHQLAALYGIVTT